uniref:Ribitol xylosyltransferase 1 n=1 Tax=Oncorhynchus tshawytscha TaxID=74940 RepID=A0AAZ3R0X9_ONCTS
CIITACEKYVAVAHRLFQFTVASSGDSKESETVPDSPGPKRAHPLPGGNLHGVLPHLRGCAYSSVPVVEDIVTPGGCSAAHSSPLRLLKAAGALFIFLKDYKELPGLLEKEKGMSQEERTERRRLLEWYSSFHLQMKDRFTEVLEVNRKALRRVMRSAQRITGGKLPAVQDTYSTRCHGKAKKIIKDNNHPSHCLFTQLPSRRCGHFRCIKAGSMRLKNSFCLKAIRLLNSNH